MRRHHHVGRLRNLREGNKFHLHQLVERLVDLREARMTVDVGVPVPRKMFGAGDRALSAQTVDIRGAKLRDDLRIVGKRPNADDRIVRVVVHVERRTEIHVKPERDKLPADDSARRDRAVGVARRRERHVPRRGDARVESRHKAALLVDRNEHRDSRRGFPRRVLNLVGKSDCLLGSLAVLRKKADSAELEFRDRVGELVVEFDHGTSLSFAVPTAERDANHLTDLLFDGHFSDDLTRIVFSRFHNGAGQESQREENRRA